MGGWGVTGRCNLFGFQKAFDKVPHKRLILKLKSYVMRNSIINQSINQSKNLFHTLIIKYNIFKNNYVGKGKV